MAEQNQEITYIPYGQDEISQQDLMTSLANGVEGYLGSKRWARKDKYRNAWLAAYQDIINHGLTGASNETGVWTVNHGQGPIDLNNKSNTEREMYQDAAYYIQQKMSQMTPRKKEEEKKKENLEKFGDFKTNFTKQILSNRFGNNEEIFKDSEQGWGALDARGTNGLRGTSERRKAMIAELKTYKNSLNDKDYNFEGTSFKDKSDLQSKIQDAIDALENTPDNESDDLPAFSALGLPYRSFFSNGGNDIYGTTNDGKQVTYQQYYENQQKEAQEKAKAEAIKLKTQKANQYTNFRFFGNKLNGKLLSGDKSNNAIGYLNSLAQKANLTGDEQSEIVGAFKLAAKNNVLQNLSKEELSKFGTAYLNHPTRLKKINGVNGLYWDSIGNRVVQPYNQTTTPLTTNFQDIVNQNTPEYLAQQKKQQEEQRRIDAGNRKVNDGEWQTEDYLRMGAMAQDIAGTVAAFLPGYGTAASAGLGLTALGTNMAADIADDSVSGLEVAKNAGINLGLGVIGLVPGLGLASKSGKWIAQVAKWAPRLLTMAAAGQIALDDNIKQSLAKVTSNETLTVNDWKNVGYALSTMAGLARGARGIVDNRKYKPAFKEASKTETFITTKSGKKVSATKEQVDKINKAGRKGGNEKANEELRKLPGAENEEVNIEFKTGVKGKVDLKNKVKLEESTTSTSTSPRVQAYQRALQIQNSARKSGQGIYSLAPRFLPTSYDIYSGATRLSLPQWNVIDKIKKAWNPIGESKKISSPKQVQQQTSGNQPQPIESEPLFNIKRPIKEPKSKLTYGKKDLSEVDRSFEEIRNFKKSYGLDGNNSPMVGGYGQSGNNIKSGTLNFEIDGQKITFKVSKSELKDINEGKISNIRGRIARQVDQISSSKKADVNEIAKILKDLKKKGWLKQGGTITNLDTEIKEILKTL